MSSLRITASNIKNFDNYVLYRISQEATTKHERDLAKKEIKHRQNQGNMVQTHSFEVTSSNVKDLDNYVLYRAWKEATTKKERSLAMKEIHRRQKLGNMVENHNSLTKRQRDMLSIIKEDPGYYVSNKSKHKEDLFKLNEYGFIRMNEHFSDSGYMNGWNLYAI